MRSPLQHLHPAAEESAAANKLSGAQAAHVALQVADVGCGAEIGLQEELGLEPERQGAVNREGRSGTGHRVGRGGLHRGFGLPKMVQPLITNTSPRLAAQCTNATCALP